MLRVIQWATGNVGRHAAAAIHHHPDLVLVGALVYSATKAGRDVGDLCIRTFLDLPMITGRGVLG